MLIILQDHSNEQISPVHLLDLMDFFEISAKIQRINLIRTRPKESSKHGRFGLIGSLVEVN